MFLKNWRSKKKERTHRFFLLSSQCRIDTRTVSLLENRFGIVLFLLLFFFFFFFFFGIDFIIEASWYVVNRFSFSMDLKCGKSFFWGGWGGGGVDNCSVSPTVLHVYISRPQQARIWRRVCVCVYPWTRPCLVVCSCLPLANQCGVCVPAPPVSQAHANQTWRGKKIIVACLCCTFGWRCACPVLIFFFFFFFFVWDWMRFPLKLVVPSMMQSLMESLFYF